METVEQMTPEDAVRAALHGFEFQYELPLEISDALEEGVVAIANPRWTRSDDPERSNFLELTPTGWEIAQQLGLVAPTYHFQESQRAGTEPKPNQVVF